MAWQQPNPDDRSDNVERLQEAINNTVENMCKAEDALEHASDKDRADIEAKNHRREESLTAMRNEVKEEAADRENGYS
ncbi:small acid-soluble spore protein Tlp [Priestia filamentosa]|uniref:small acid-soluble spore protein Tlp n=1 Tax=Priestia filamentosa TaxID=1402861 RepID=UPI001FB4C1ED|nr:small acid-soluble spore protein Tlp [Priestia filamentosa]MED3725869.1 small acid-soluble spore protein Tlp [Priestia filamentosa]UOE61965.1 small acid-soluble spore protein Tlp [Priestia filamentosa]